MNELSHLTRRHYERNEADASLVSKVTRILDSLPDGSVDSSQLAAYTISLNKQWLPEPTAKSEGLPSRRIIMQPLAFLWFEMQMTQQYLRENFWTSPMGNSEAVCKRHYLETLTREEGASWFKIRRSKAGAEAVSMVSAKAA